MTEAFQLIGCDFGGSARAGEQAKKIILIEASRLEDGCYRINPTGRNERLVREASGSTWRERRRGWTADELVASLLADSNVNVVAFDFPFSIPLQLLKSEPFAAAVDQPTFQTRNQWTRFISQSLRLEFSTDKASGKLNGLSSFAPWRSRENWIKRRTDVAARSQPSLKDLYQSTFNMTLVGNAVLSALRPGGLTPLLNPSRRKTSQRYALEAYPGAAARSMGFRGAYKQQPGEVIEHACDWLAEQGVQLRIDDSVRLFCETYESGPNDHDGADAFLCLVTAIAFHEGLVSFLTDGAPQATLNQEGCIVVPGID